MATAVLDTARVDISRHAYYATRISEHRAITPEGYLICKNIPIARTGWQRYRTAELGIDGEGLVDVYRSPDQVFAKETIASFESKSVTSPHPPVFLTAENDAAYSKGHIQNVREGDRLPDGERTLICDIVIKDAGLISLVDSGAREELSCGYQCLYVPTEEEGKWAQTRIRGNHLAVVGRGRAGEEVRILDSKPEEDQLETQEKPAVQVIEQPPSFASLRTFFSDARDFFLGIGYKAPTMDADPGATERNKEKNEEAAERAKMRNKDEDKEEEKEVKKKESKDDDDDRRRASAKDDDDRRRAKDEDEPDEKKEEKKSKDRKSKDKDDEERRAAKDAEEVEGKSLKGKATDEAGSKEICSKLDTLIGMMAKSMGLQVVEVEKSADAELIPVETLSEEDRPKNPIPGAPKSLDSRDALDALIAIKPSIVSAYRSNPCEETRKACDEWNRVYSGLKYGAKNGGGSYADIANARKPLDVVAAEQRAGAQRQGTYDAAAVGSDFETQARKFHRRNAGEVLAEAQKARVN